MSIDRTGMDPASALAAARAAQARRTESAQAAGGAAAPFAPAASDEAGPVPAEALRDVQLASRRLEALDHAGITVRFGVSEEDGGVTGEVLDSDGRVLRSIPAEGIADIAGGTEQEAQRWLR